MEKKKSAGISITENHIRFVELEFHNKSATIIRFQEIPLPEGLPDDLYSSQGKELAKSLKNMFQLDRFKGKIFVTVPDREVAVREKVIPPLKTKDIFKIIETEVKDYAIFEHQNVSIGFTIVDRDDEKYKIIWAGVKEETALRIIKLFRLAGRRISGILPSNFAVSKVIHSIYKEEVPVAIINVDTRITTLTFIERGRIIYTYAQETGSADLSLDDDSAKNVWVGNILTAFNHITRTTSKEISKAYLIAQEEQGDDLREFLEQKLTCPTILPELTTFFGSSDEGINTPRIDHGTEYLQAAGAALFAASDEQDPLFCDVSKHVLVERVSLKIKALTVALILVLVNGLFFAALPFVNRTNINLQQSIKNIDTKIAEISETSQDAENLINYVQQLRSEVEVYKNIRTNATKGQLVSSLLTELRARLPASVYISSISVNSSGEISLVGKAANYKSVMEYEENLAFSEYIEWASITSMSKGTEGTVTFNMVARAKGD